MNSEDQDRQDKTREILRRLEADNTSFVTGSLNTVQQKLASHLKADDTQVDDKKDDIVKWATRIGRAAGLIFFAVLVLNLFTGWFF